MTACIPLAKPYTPEKLEFPVYASTKYDGVPVRIDINCKQGGTSLHFRSRQGEPLWSVESLVTRFAAEYARNRLVYGLPEVITLVGEVLQEPNWFAPFKDTSGIVRRQENQMGLCIKLFDVFSPVWKPGVESATEFLRKLDLLGDKKVRAVEFTKLETSEELGWWWERHQVSFPHAEGVVFKGASYLPEAGKRSWQYQKGVVDPIIDLRIVGFEEGKGKNAGAVGRLIAEYKGNRIGIGPGKLDYEMRRALWVGRNTQHSHIGKIAKIKYKVDPSYDALRQPTFQDWHHGKTEPDA